MEFIWICEARYVHSKSGLKIFSIERRFLIASPNASFSQPITKKGNCLQFCQRKSPIVSPIWLMKKEIKNIW
jgi:hypothetical protein